jgi:Recombination endonuclease VII
MLRVNIRMSSRALTINQEKSVISEYVDGSSMEGLAKRYGCSTGTIRNYLVRNGVQSRHCGPKPVPVGLTKICSSCGGEFPRLDFYTEGKRNSKCKLCTSQHNEDKYYGDQKHRRKKIASSTRYHRKVKNCWTQDQFEAAWVQQQGRCAICNQDMVRGGTRSSSVNSDHDHTTGTPRALLCARCNKGLGMFNDSPEILHLASMYLRKFSI